MQVEQGREVPSVPLRYNITLVIILNKRGIMIGRR